MEAVQWAESCKRYEALYPTRRLSDGTVAAWYEEFGEWADYPLAMRAISRLAAESDRAPSLASWREMHGGLVRERAALRALEEGERVRTDGPGSAVWDRRHAAYRDWKRIHEHLGDPRISAMFHALVEQYAHPTDPAAWRFNEAKHNDQAMTTRLALIAEIEALGLDRRSMT